MSDEPFYSPNRTPKPTRQPKPDEHVWAVFKPGRRIDCELLFHGESSGWECQLIEDSALSYGARFMLREQALEEAEAQRRRLIGEGWIAESPERCSRVQPVVFIRLKLVRRM